MSPGLGIMEMTVVALTLAAVIGWVPVALLGLLRLRAAPAPSLLLIAAGIVGVITAIAAPILQQVYWATLGASVGVDHYVAHAAATQGAYALLASVPWILLLVAIWRTLLAIPPSDASP